MCATCLFNHFKLATITSISTREYDKSGIRPLVSDLLQLFELNGDHFKPTPRNRISISSYGYCYFTIHPLLVHCVVLAMLQPILIVTSVLKEMKK
jgi:hypothetical protein